jgi:hypothetical protein
LIEDHKPPFENFFSHKLSRREKISRLLLDTYFYHNYGLFLALSESHYCRKLWIFAVGPLAWILLLTIPRVPPRIGRNRKFQEETDIYKVSGSASDGHPGMDPVRFTDEPPFFGVVYGSIYFWRPVHDLDHDSISVLVESIL